MDYGQSDTNNDFFNQSLENYLIAEGVWYKFIAKPETIHTKDASLHTGIDLNKITKSLVFLTDKNPVMVIVPGNKRVDMNKLSICLTGTITLVPFDKAKEYSGYDPGATSPVKHKNISMTIIDKSLLVYETIYGGGGARDRLVELRTEDIIRLTGAIVEDVII